MTTPELVLGLIAATSWLSFWWAFFELKINEDLPCYSIKTKIIVFMNAAYIIITFLIVLFYEWGR